MDPRVGAHGARPLLHRHLRRLLAGTGRAPGLRHPQQPLARSAARSAAARARRSASCSRAFSMATAAQPAIPSASRSSRSVNTSGSAWPKNSPPSTSPERDDDRHGQVAAHGKVALGHPVVRRVLSVARVAGDVAAAHDPLAVEGRREHLGVAGHGEARERLARHAGEGVEGVRLARLVEDVVEERAELRAGERRGLVRGRLHHAAGAPAPP